MSLSADVSVGVIGVGVIGVVGNVARSAVSSLILIVHILTVSSLFGSPLCRLIAPLYQKSILMWCSLTKGGPEGRPPILGRANFGERVQHKGGTG